MRRSPSTPTVAQRREHWAHGAYSYSFGTALGINIIQSIGYGNQDGGVNGGGDTASSDGHGRGLHPHGKIIRGDCSSLDISCCIFRNQGNTSYWN